MGAPEVDAPGGSAEDFAAAITGVWEELDWPRLERTYCTGDADGFFAPDQRAAILDTGLLFADDVAGALAELPASRPGAGSLYLGAAVAELAPILAEHIVLGRRVRWVNLPGPETDELNRALAAVAARLGRELPHVEVDGPDALAPAACDLLWCASVLSDPESFPALHDRLYGRDTAPPGAPHTTEPAERERAARLLDLALARLAPPAVLFTSDEERELLRAACARRGWTLEPAATARLSGIVGDPVRACRVRGATMKRSG